MAISKSILDLIGKTPLLELNKIPASYSHCKAQVVAKLEYFNPASSVKDRLAFAMVEAAEKAGILKADAGSPQMIVEPTSGNTGIGLALVAAVKGYGLTLFMPESMSEERKKLLRGLGANLNLTPAAKGMRGAIEAAEEFVKQHSGAVMLQQFLNEAGPEIHERTTATEIWKDCEGKIDCFVAGVGTGGTVTGVARFLKAQNPHIHICAVEPAESAVISGNPPSSHPIQGIGAGFIPKILEVSLLDEVFKVSGEQALAMAKRLMKEEGIFAGISSGAAAHAAIQLACREEFVGKRIVFIVCDTADRYLSTALFA